MKDKQITLDYQEYLNMETELDSLRKPAEGSALSEAEHQEAVGILLTRALSNPDLFRQVAGPIDLGNYKAIFVSSPQLNTGMRVPIIRVKFERT